MGPCCDDGMVRAPACIGVLDTMVTEDSVDTSVEGCDWAATAADSVDMSTDDCDGMSAVVADIKISTILVTV